MILFTIGIASEQIIIADAKTEADLTVTAPSTTSGHTEQSVTLGKVNETTDAKNNKATFTPSDAGYYAIQYCSDNSKKPVVYKYKVIKVVDPSSGN